MGTGTPVTPHGVTPRDRLPPKTAEDVVKRDEPSLIPRVPPPQTTGWKQREAAGDSASLPALIKDETGLKKYKRKMRIT